MILGNESNGVARSHIITHPIMALDQNREAAIPVSMMVNPTTQWSGGQAATSPSERALTCVPTTPRPPSSGFTVQVVTISRLTQARSTPSQQTVVNDGPGYDVGSANRRGLGQSSEYTYGDSLRTTGSTNLPPRQ